MQACCFLHFQLFCQQLFFLLHLHFLKEPYQYIVLLVFGVLVLAFISGAAAVTQDVIHPGFKSNFICNCCCCSESSWCINCTYCYGKIYDLTNIQTALSILPLVLLIGAVLFWLGSRYYVKDLGKVPRLNLRLPE